MDKFTVACVQMRMRLPMGTDEYREELRRYLRAADAKRARLVLFPELAGLMVAPLLLRDRRTNLLRSAEGGRRRSAGAWERVRGRAAGWAAGLLKADLYASVAGLLDVEPGALWTLYAELFGGLARTHGVTIVAPSAYLPGPDGGPLENRCAVFGPNGDLLGTQSKVLGFSEDEQLVKKGSSWKVVETELGRAGIVLGSDILYPEVGRLLAYQGADFLLLQGACPTPAFYNKLRAGALARMQDNQLYAGAAFVVGDAALRKRGENGAAPLPYVGRSAIFAPQELTPRANGVQVEMGAGGGEGVVTAEWDFVALRSLWKTSDTPLRRALPEGEAGLLMSALYAQLRALPPAPAAQLLSGPLETGDEALIEVDGQEPAGSSGAPAASTGKSGREQEGESIDLDMLPLIGSVTSRWPLRRDVERAAESAAGAEVAQQVIDWPAPRRYGEGASQVRREDETDEMDAVESGHDLPSAPETEKEDTAKTVHGNNGDNGDG